MAKGFYISKLLAGVGIVFTVAAVATIIALAVVYAEEKAKNVIADPEPTKPSTAPTSGTGSSTTSKGTPTATAATSPPPNNTWNQYRLPKTLLPTHYDVQLQPFLETNSQGLYIFKGKSEVHFLCTEETNLILMHSKKLNYTGNFTLKKGDGSAYPTIRRTWLEVTTQYLVVELKRYLVAGQSYSFATEFTGELADDLAGFYRSEYMEGGQKRIIATTQMQAPDARKAFPCFDEPAMKATFNITLIYKPQFVALSNMPNISTTTVQADGATWHVTTFEKTPRMSTYLLAFIVCDFDYVEDLNTTQIRIWGRTKAIQENQGEYALNVTGPILKFFADYYRVPYPLPKSDQIALPDFNAGAMENWGLVTYRETALLYDPLISSIGNKERVATIIAHELAHQWFGNLVTVRWWNDLWLNEGFASYVEYLGADHAEPTWNITDLIVLNDVHKVMAVDALASSHPLTSREEEVNTPAEISELFDSITYSKGASVIRMLSGFLTEPLFVEGLRAYLMAFSYDNTDYNDLWFHLQNAVNANKTILPKTVKEIMDTWVLQMGFPVVKVDTGTGAVTQQHFLLDPQSVVDRPSQFNYTWIVPMTSMTTSSLNPQLWLDGPTAIFPEFKVTGSEWLLLNLDVVGYYRVNYDTANWNKLLSQLNSDPKVIPLINRAQIIDDAFNLARAKHIETTLALDTTRFLKNETEYMPWQAALNSLSYFTLMFDRSSVYGPMKNYLRKQVEPLFKHFKDLTLNWTQLPEGLTQQYNQVNAISAACSYGIEECGELASGLFKQWMANEAVNPITPNLRSTIYCNAIARGGEEEWDFAYRMFKNATVATEADKLRSAMACSKEPWILNRYLELTLKPDEIRKQDATSTINSIGSNVVGQSLAWDFIRANWAKIFNEYGGGSFSFSGLINSITRRFASEFELKQLEQFQKDNADTGFGSGTRALEQALEKTKANIKWVHENSATVKTWFEEAA
ncbi:aminopeptidase N-like [Ambystoma mexicanum]|uniref:aminopeptidase N-like n=1 Tax=Ambystoma mexicanum TaxID=8296 RepID=UPI0037E8B725